MNGPLRCPAHNARLNDCPCLRESCTRLRCPVESCLVMYDWRTRRWLATALPTDPENEDQLRFRRGA